MGHAHSEDSDGKIDPFTFAMGCLVLILVGSAIIANLDTIFTIAGDYLSLTPSDVMMIPVGAISFTAFWIISDRVIFRPYIKLIEEREEKTSGAEESAEDTLREARQLLSEYDERLLKARIDATQEKMKIVSEERRESKKIVEEANIRAKHHIEKARKEINDRLEELHQEVMTQADALVTEITEKVKQVPASTINSVH